MNTLFFLTTGFLFGMLAMYGYMRQRRGRGSKREGEEGACEDCAELERELARTRKELEEEEQEIAGSGSLEEFNETQARKKVERKQHVLDLFDAHEEVKNSDVADALEVSSSTAYNYLEELESDGAIEQVGHTGRSVIYKRSE